VILRRAWANRLLLHIAEFAFLTAMAGVTTSVAAPRNDFVSFEVSPPTSSSSMVFDRAHHRIFVALMTANRIAVLSSTTHAVVGSIFVPAPTSVDISPDGTRIAVGTATQYIYTINTSTLAVAERIPFNAIANNPVYLNYLPLQVIYLNNGKALLRVYDGVTLWGGVIIVEWDIATNSFTPRTDIGSGDIENMVRSADYRKVFMGGGNGGAVMLLYDADSDSVHSAQVGTLGYGGPIAASPDGTQFAAYIWYYGGLSAVVYLDAQMNEVGRKNCLNVWGLTYSADGRYLYISENADPPAVIYVVDTQTQEIVGEIADSPIVRDRTRLQGVDDTGVLYGSSNHGVAFLNPSFSTLTGSGPQFSFPSALAPNSGPLGGGTPVRLQGTFPAGTSSVYFGGNLANSAQGGQFSIPPGNAAGPVNVSWFSNAGWFALAPEGFSYGPYVKEVMATAGSPDGGQEIPIWGYGFGSSTDSITVKVGGATASLVSPISISPLFLGSEENPFPLQQLVIRTPPGTPGFAAISITPASGTTTVPRAFQYLRESKTYPHSGILSSPTYDPFRNLLYIAAGDRVEVFDTVNEAYKPPLPVPAANSASAQLSSLDITPDGSQLLATDAGAQALYIFDLNGPGVRTIDLNLGTGYSPAAVVASNTGKAVVQFSSNNSPCCFLKQVDLASGQVEEFPSLTGCGGPTIAGAEGGSKLFIALTGCSTGMVYLYDFQSGNLKSDYLGAFLLEASASADGNTFSLGGGLVPTVLDGALLLKARPWRSAYYDNTAPLWGQTVNASGSLIYDPVTLNVNGGATQNYIDVLDVHHGNSASRVITPELLAGPTNPGRLLTLDPSGQRMFAVTQSGLSVLEFAATPLSVGGVYPTYSSPEGGESATIRGSGFQQGASLKIGDTSVASTWVDEDTLSITVPPLPLGLAAITVTNPDGTSYIWPDAFLVTAPRPTPIITSISPQQWEVSSTGPVLTVDGASFFRDSVVRFNGTDRPTSYVGDTELTAQLSGSDLQTPTTAQISVFTPLGGGTSNAQTFTVVNPVPEVNLVSPTRLVVGDPGANIIIFGNKFVNSSIARWNGTPLTTSYDSSSLLNVVVPAALMAVSGTATIDVVNPAPGGGTSSTLPMVVGPKGPYLTNPDHVDMGQIPVGALKYVDVGMRNTGTDLLTVSGVTLSGPFQLLYNGQTLFDPYALLQIQIVATPTQAGAMSGTLTVTDNTDTSPHIIPVTAQAVVMQPSATTGGAFGVTDTTATLTGDANPNGPDTNAWFEYGTSPTLQSSQKSLTQIISSSIYALHFEAAITGLQPDTTYYYRAAANNANGSAAGTIASFTTKSPDFSFDVPLNVTLTVKAGGAVAYDNLPVVASSGFRGDLTFACLGAPENASCDVTPASGSLSPGGQVFLHVTVTTKATIATNVGTSGHLRQVAVALALSIFTVSLVLVGGVRSTRLCSVVLFLCIALPLITAGCGGGSNIGGGGGNTGGGGSPPPPPQAGTPAGTYVLNIVATGNGRTKSQNLTLVVN
jgi:hypothetical protein